MKIRNVVALVVGIFFAIVLSELILQILDLPPRPISGWTNCKIKNPGECNFLGFRGREINYASDDFVVLLVGDSEMYARHLPFNKMPERRLEHFLKKFKKNVKVFTIADMGYGQDQQLLALKKYFKNHRADLVMLMFTIRDDLVNNIFPISGGKDSIKPTFFVKDAELQGPTEEWLEPVDGYRFKLEMLWNHFFGKKPGKVRLEVWEKNILPRPYVPMRNYEGEVDYSWQEMWNEYPLTALKGIELQKVGPVNKFTPRSDRWAYGIELTRALLSEIRELVVTNGGTFVLFKEERPAEADHRKEKVYVLNDRYYRISMSQYHENLRDIFNGFDYYIIPLQPGGHNANPDNYHFTVEMIDEIFRNISHKVSREKYFTAE